METQGKFIVFEGLDGCGKTTQIRMLQEWLKSINKDVAVFREPGNSEFGRKLRAAMRGEINLTKEEELLFFVKDRQINVAKNIKPALEDGKIVLEDRYYYSTMAYQGALGLDIEQIKRENEKIAIPPDLLIILDLPVELSLERIIKCRGEQPNTFETVERLTKVKEIFDKMDFPYLIRVDGIGSEHEIFHKIIKHIENLFLN